MALAYSHLWRLRREKASLVLTATAATFFLAFLGSPSAALRPAPREPLRLSLEERQHMLQGMRVFLESVEGITRSLADNKMPLVAKNAKRSGWGMMDPAAAATALKLPPEFVAIGIDTHQKFDDLAAAALDGATKAQVLDRLSAILANCTSCHASYRLSPR